MDAPSTSPPSSPPASRVLSSDPSPPSSPLSDLSNSPSPPTSPIFLPSQDPSQRYPSPTSTSTSGTQSPPTSDGVAAAAAKSDKTKKSRPRTGADGTAPPAKKRKVASAPGERTTDYLDLTKPDSDWTDDDAAQLKRLVTALRKKKKIVVVAGAGISVSAGIPDFRSSTGLFAPAGSQQQKFKASGKHLFDASVYKHDSSTQSFHTMVREMAELASRAKPTPFHQLLASLARDGRLMRLYSQNIDCIDTSLEPLATNVPLDPKGPWPTTIQLHGGLEKMVCTKCSNLSPFDGKLFDGPEAPLCEACKAHDEVRTGFAGKRSHGIGRLRPRFVLYNEFNPDEEAIGRVSSADLKARPDAVLVVGTSLKVPGTRRLVKEMCQVTRGRRDGFTAFINTDSEPKGAEFRGCWDMVVRAPCDKVAREVDSMSWSCPIGENYSLSPEETLQSEMRHKETKLEIGIPSKTTTNPADEEASSEPDRATPAKLVKQEADETAQGMPTPRASPKITAAKGSGKKTKQTTLGFAAPTKDSAKAPARKPRVPVKGRKPLRTSQPKSTMAQAFRAVKVGASEQESTKAILAKTKLEDDAAGLPALRPDHKDSADRHGYPEGHVIRPSTPPQSSDRPASRDTISPKSVPNSMRDLIDVQ